MIMILDFTLHIVRLLLSVHSADEQHFVVSFSRPGFLGQFSVWNVYNYIVLQVLSHNRYLNLVAYTFSGRHAYHLYRFSVEFCLLPSGWELLGLCHQCMRLPLTHNGILSLGSYRLWSNGITPLVGIQTPRFKATAHGSTNDKLSFLGFSRSSYRGTMAGCECLDVMEELSFPSSR